MARERQGKKGKDPAAVKLGKRGGAKGGKARAEKMTAKERSEAARRAVQARWGHPSESETAIATTVNFISCPACGKPKISELAVSCPACGHPLEPTCPKCGEVIVVHRCGGNTSG